MAKSDTIKAVPSPKETDKAKATVDAAPQRPSEKVVAFVKRHPVLVTAGAVAAGMAVSAVIPRRSSRRLLSKALHLAEATGAAGMVFGKEAKDKTRLMGKGLRKETADLGHRAQGAGQATAAQLEKFGVAALAAAGALGRTTASRAEKLGDAAGEAADRLGDAAAERSRKISAVMSDIRNRLMH